MNLTVVERSDGTYAVIRDGIQICAITTFEPFSEEAKALAYDIRDGLYKVEESR